MHANLLLKRIYLSLNAFSFSGISIQLVDTAVSCMHCVSDAQWLYYELYFIVLCCILSYHIILIIHSICICIGICIYICFCIVLYCIVLCFHSVPDARWLYCHSQDLLLTYSDLRLSVLWMMRIDRSTCTAIEKDKHHHRWKVTSHHFSTLLWLFWLWSLRTICARKYGKTCRLGRCGLFSLCQFLDRQAFFLREIFKN